MDLEEQYKSAGRLMSRRLQDQGLKPWDVGSSNIGRTPEGQWVVHDLGAVDEFPNREGLVPRVPGIVPRQPSPLMNMILNMLGSPGSIQRELARPSTIGQGVSFGDLLASGRRELGGVPRANPNAIEMAPEMSPLLRELSGAKEAGQLLGKGEGIDPARFPSLYRGTESGTTGAHLRESAEGGELGVGTYVTPHKWLAATYGGGPKASVEAGTRAVHELKFAKRLYPEEVGHLRGGLEGTDAVLETDAGVPLWQGKWEAMKSQRDNINEMNRIARESGLKVIFGADDSVARNQAVLLDKDVVRKVE
jgi:hypothetical protein